MLAEILILERVVTGVRRVGGAGGHLLLLLLQLDARVLPLSGASGCTAHTHTTGSWFDSVVGAKCQCHSIEINGRRGLTLRTSTATLPITGTNSVGYVLTMFYEEDFAIHFSHLPARLRDKIRNISISCLFFTAHVTDW